MRRFQHIEPLDGHGYDDDRCNEPVTITVSLCWIAVMYFPAWKTVMRAQGKASMCSFENCVQDYITVNWGWEL
jgi:hypothetical protein